MTARTLRVTVSIDGKHLRRASRILQGCPGGAPDVLDLRLDSLADAFDRDEILHVPAKRPTPVGYIGPKSWEKGRNHAETALLEALADARRRLGREVDELIFNRKVGLVPGPDAVDHREWAARYRSTIHDLIRAIRLVRADQQPPS